MKLSWQPHWVTDIAKEIKQEIQAQWEEIVRVINYEEENRSQTGEMYADNAGQTVTISVAETYYDIDGGMEEGTCSDAFTFQNDRELLCNLKGRYLVNWSLAVAVGAANQTVEGGVGINSVSQEKTESHGHASSANSEMALGGTGILDLDVGDIITLMVLNYTSTNDIVVEHANLTLIRISDI